MHENISRFAPPHPQCSTSKLRLAMLYTLRMYKCKNISIKVLKDVGMTVPKSRETSAVYMQQDGMRACNNNSMHNQN